MKGTHALSLMILINVSGNILISTPEELIVASKWLFLFITASLNLLIEHIFINVDSMGFRHHSNRESKLLFDLWTPNLHSWLTCCFLSPQPDAEPHGRPWGPCLEGLHVRRCPLRRNNYPLIAAPAGLAHWLPRWHACPECFCRGRLPQSQWMSIQGAWFSNTCQGHHHDFRKLQHRTYKMWHQRVTRLWI